MSDAIITTRHIWKCSFCGVEADGSSAMPPAPWRIFQLREKLYDAGYNIGEFALCDKCVKPYKSMHPIRKALSLLVKKR